MSDFEKLKEDFKNKLARAQNSNEVDLIRAEISVSYTHLTLPTICSV